MSAVKIVRYCTRPYVHPYTQHSKQKILSLLRSVYPLSHCKTVLAPPAQARRVRADKTNEAGWLDREGAQQSMLAMLASEEASRMSEEASSDFDLLLGSQAHSINDTELAVGAMVFGPGPINARRCFHSQSK